MKKTRLIQLFSLLALISFLLVSCGGGGDETKPAKTKASGSAMDKMISMATSSIEQLNGIQEDAKSVTDIKKLTKIAEDLTKKEQELNAKFIDFVAKNAANMVLPVEQNIHMEFYEIKTIQFASAESLEKVIVDVNINALKIPYPNIDNRVYLKLVDKKGNKVQKFVAPAPFGKELNGKYSWNPHLSPSMFEGAVKAVVISEEEFKSL